MATTKDPCPSKLRGLANTSGVACHINSVLLLLAHCKLPLNNSASIGLTDVVKNLSLGNAVDLQECYQFLQAKFQIDVEELGDPVIAMRKLLDMNHPLLSGGVLQTTLTQTHGNATRTKELKPSRMPNPLPVSTSYLAVEKLFRSRILSEEPIQNYKWPGDTNSSFNEGMTMRNRKILQLPELFMIHLQPLSRMTNSDGASNASNLPMMTRLDNDTFNESYELHGAIVHIASCEKEDWEEEEGGHTATILQWAGPAESLFYLIDDSDVHVLKPNEVETLLQGTAYPYSQPDESTYSSAVLLVYRKQNS